MLRVAIFLLKHAVDLLSLMFSGKELQMEAPSYINLFFILFVLGFDKRIELEVRRRLWFKISHSKINNFLRELGSMFFKYFLNIIFALAFFLCFSSGSQPNILSTVCSSTSFGTCAIIRAALL